MATKGTFRRRQQLQWNAPARRVRIAAAYFELNGVDLDEEESRYWLYD